MSDATNVNLGINGNATIMRSVILLVYQFFCSA